MLYVDIPTRPEIKALVQRRGDAMVSIYLPTTPQSQHVETTRIELGNLRREAEQQLEAAGVDKRTIAPVSEQLADLEEDYEFWRFQANSLAIFVSPDRLWTYRLPNKLVSTVQVADRFHIKPLIRAISLPQHAFVLALAEGEVRLIEVNEDSAEEVRIRDMPTESDDVRGDQAFDRKSDRAGWKKSGEGQKLHLRKFARAVDAALRPVLAGREEPLIVAATDPILPIFREVCSYPHLAAEAIETSPVRIPAAELGGRARPIIDAVNERAMQRLRDLYAERENQGRAISDIAHTARAATFGAVDTLMVDMDEVVTGTVDDETGVVHFETEADALSYGIVDEIAGRTLANGGEVIAVRRADLPVEGSLAAILRFAI